MTALTSAKSPQIQPVLRFNSNQQQAIDTNDRPILVLSCAGTGKTAVIIAKYLNAVMAGSAESAIAITYTRRAAKELSQRIPADMRQDALIGTFHHLGAIVNRRAYQAHIIDRLYRIADDNDQMHYAVQALNQAKQTETHRETSTAALDSIAQSARQILAAIDRMKSSGYMPVADGYQTVDGHITAFVDGLPRPGSQQHKTCLAYQTQLEADGRCDFHDIILRATRILIGHGHSIFPDTQLVLVDELQDVDSNQFRFIIEIAKGRSLTCVGDDDQSIFAWRGGRVEHVLDFATYFPDSERITLDINYRCPPEILGHALRLVSHNDTRRLEKHVISADADDLLQSIFLHDINVDHSGTTRASLEQLKNTEIPAYIASIVQQLISSGSKPSDITCITRTNDEIAAIESQLDQLRIRVNIANPNGISSPELRQLLAWLRLLKSDDDYAAFALLAGVSPNDRQLQDAISAKTAKGLSFIAFLQHEDQTHRLKSQKFKNMLSRYQELMSMLPHQTMTEVITHLCENFILPVKSEMTHRRTEQFWSAYGHIITSLAHIDSLDGIIEQLQIETSEDDYVDENTVELSTIHSTKGRQKQIVILGSFIDGIFPSFMAIQQNKKSLQEERRLAYVAMTRARSELHIIVAGQRPSHFLTEAGLARK